MAFEDFSYDIPEDLSIPTVYDSTMYQSESPVYSTLYSATPSEQAIDSGLFAQGAAAANQPSLWDTISGLYNKAPSALKSGLQGLLGGNMPAEGGTLTNYLQGNAGSLTALLGLYSLMGGNKKAPAGYAGSIPKLTATREQIAQPAGRRPGSAAGPYFAPIKYAAEGGYLRGATGGMADELDTTIDGKQPAKLSHGEFVIPADVVSHLGDGNSEAGAKKLYQMMDKVRQARTGKKAQAPEIKAEKFMPKMANGGIVAFVDGGLATTLTGPSQIGQTNTASVSNLAPWAGEYVTGMLGKAQALSNLPYATYTGDITPGESALQQKAFQGLSALTTPAGIGAAEQRTAQLGQQLGNLSYAPTSFGYEQFTPQAAQQYMNPYLQAALNPQLEEAKRQADIQRVQQSGRLTKAGAYGGSRQAIMESELARNLGQNLANITGQGYNTAYQQAAQQFASDQARKAAAQAASESSRQFGASYGLQGLQQGLSAAQQQAGLANLGQQAGLQNIQAQLGAGATQRDIEAQGLAADYKRFQEERDWPYKMAQYQQSFLQGLPISTTSYEAQTSPFQDIMGGGLGLLGLYETLSKLGQQTPAATTPATTPAK
jgi:hypothetical protein